VVLDISVKTAEQLSLIAQFDATASSLGSSPAIVHGDTRLTWADVRDQSRVLAKALLAGGISRGDHVALWMPNHPKWLLFWLGAMRIGAAAVPINTRYKPTEAAYVLEKSEARALVIEREFLGVDYAEAFSTICPDWDGHSSTKLPKLARVIVDGSALEGLQSFEEFAATAALVSDAELGRAETQTQPDDTVIVVFTSGTTGNPKGVMHTHNVLRMLRALADHMGIGPEDRILGHLPLFHVAGVFSSFLLAMIKGGALIQLDQWNPRHALELIAREGVTVMSGVPTHFIDILRHPDLNDFDRSSLRIGWIGGATIPAEVLAGARDRLTMETLLPVYGMTENTAVTVVGGRTDAQDILIAGKGRPLGGYEVEVVDPKTREPESAGTEGEIRVRGYLVMKGYYREEAATQAVLKPDGWFYTGDLGVFDGHGYLSITGRLTDKFIVGGNNVHPADIEHSLTAHQDVKQAHVVSRPDDRLGEVAVAFIELVPGATSTPDDLIAHCRRLLADFKVPREVIIVNDWPTTATGKVQRFKLREIAASKASQPK